MERTEKFALREFALEEKEETYLEKVKAAFDAGNIDDLIKDRDKAARLIRRRERRITYRLIRSAKRAKIAVSGKSIDIFEKELLEKHRRLYDIVGKIDYDAPDMITGALELEKEILTDVRALISELEKAKPAKLE